MYSKTITFIILKSERMPFLNIGLAANIREKMISDYLKMSNSYQQIKNLTKVKNERQTGNNIYHIQL